MGSFFYIMKKYSINRWSEVFENADSRKRQRLGLYYMPSGCDSSGYLGLMSEFEPAEAWQAYGIFVALCQHTATMTKDVRGTFQNTDGTAMTTRRLALIVRADLGILERSLEILMDKRVGWVSATDLPAICQQSASDVPQNSGFVQGEGEGEGEGEDKPKPKSKAFNPPTLEEFVAYAQVELPKLNPDWQADQITRCAQGKYDTYVADQWHDGYGKKIKNWKMKAKNSLKYEKPWNYGQSITPIAKPTNPRGY